MPLVRIIEGANLVYVKYGPLACAAEAQRQLPEYLAHENFRTLQHHLVDLSAVERYVKDHAAIMQLNARLLETAPPASAAPMLGIYAPTPAGQEYAQYSRQMLKGSDQFVVLVDAVETRLLEAMGLKASTIAQVLDTEASDR